MRHLFKILPLVLAYVAAVLLVLRYGNRDLLFVVLSFAIMVPILYLVIDRFVQKNRLLSMKEEALRAELSLLKSQINPHFFFNTLNNLYGLVVEQSEQAPRMILELAELMRFTIYEGRKDHVPLEDEIAYLDHYLAIQALRSQKEKVEVTFTKEVEYGMVPVPPLLLIILVENAFKHGVASLTEGAFVHIRLHATRETLDFEVVNNFEPIPGRGKGIGTTNLKRRLALLFPERHQYRTQIENGTYRATLRLSL